MSETTQAQHIMFSELIEPSIPGMTFLDPLQPPFSVHGLVIERDGDRATWHRLPKDIIGEINDTVTRLASYTSGGRIRFATDAARVCVRVKPSNPEFRSNMTDAATVGCDLYVDGEFVEAVFSWERGTNVYERTVNLPSGTHEIMIHLPLYSTVESVVVGVSDGASVAPAKPYRITKPILFYGSSITHGVSASRPGLAYPAMLSRWLDADIINLGLSGNCKGERILADYFAGLDISAFVLDYDHNAPTVQHLIDTHEPFFKVIRAAKPNLPIIMVSRPNTANSPDWRERRDVVRRTYENAKAAGDVNVYFIDGSELFGSDDRDACVIDGTHPNDLGFYRMAQGIYQVLRDVVE